jgi:hypothetical protein
LVCAFHAALIAGAPWGELTLGGRWQGRLPPAGRVLSAISLLLLASFGFIVTTHAGLTFFPLLSRSRWLIWLVVVVLVVGVFANAVTRSRRERLVWLPVVVAMLLLALIVALTGSQEAVRGAA